MDELVVNMSRTLPPVDTVGRFRSGIYAGKGVIVWRDRTESVPLSERGWHIEIFDPPLDSPDGETWDIWADDEDQLIEWFSTPEFDVEWPMR
jgi:hypothetical protein